MGSSLRIGVCSVGVLCVDVVVGEKWFGIVGLIGF